MTGRFGDTSNSAKSAGVRHSDPAYVAIDLGTNSCRMLVAVPSEAGFHVVDGFSKVVRLGERVAETGRLLPAAVDRTLDALDLCAHRLGHREIAGFRAVATEACRRAEDSDAFIEKVRARTGFDMEIIDADEEAALTAAGCGEMLCSGYEYALVFDIGGGSTEIMWLATPRGQAARILATTSLPFGVVSLRDEFGAEALSDDIFDALLARIDATLAPFDLAHGISEAIARGDVRMIGTSGTVTTLGAMYLQLPRYNRARVDGLEIRFDSIRQISARLAGMSCAERERHPCLGVGRGDLMLMGIAVLRSVCARWPVGKLGIADRGIREGILAELMAADGHTAFGPPLQRTNGADSDQPPVKTNTRISS